MSELPTVAIVDDDEAVREAVGELLAVSGLACLTFGSAASFLAARESRRIDCLITDIRMPGMTGIELIAHLHHQGAAPPVIVLSSVLDQQVRARAFSLGIEAWFTKPVSDERLLAAIARAVESGAGSTR